jgi:Xaa-Pro dipeptidase
MQLPFNLDTYRDRVARTRARFVADDLRGVIVTLPDAINWLSGFDTIGYLWSQALIVTRDGDPLLLTRTTEEPGFHETSWLSEGRFYDIGSEDHVEVLVEELRRLDLASGRVGIDLRSFTFLPAQWDHLRRLLPEVEWVDTTDLVAEERLVKSPAELDYQRQAAQIADHAMQATIAAVRAGISEVELAGIASLALGEAGSEFPAIPPMVVSGPRSALVHAMASRRTIGRGDVVCIEMGASVNRYHAIVMRTVSVGAPSQKLIDVTSCQAEALDAAYAAAGPGAAAHAPDDACNAVLERMDLVRRRCHRVGYSIGVAYPPGWLEPMMLAAGDEHVLAPNMSFSLEPNLTLQDEGFGAKLGETAVCTEDGARSLSVFPHELIVVQRGA